MSRGIEEESTRGRGLLAALAIIAIVGMAIWFIANHDKTG